MKITNQITLFILHLILVQATWAEDKIVGGSSTLRWGGNKDVNQPGYTTEIPDESHGPSGIPPFKKVTAEQIFLSASVLEMEQLPTSLGFVEAEKIDTYLRERITGVPRYAQISLIGSSAIPYEDPEVVIHKVRDILGEFDPRITLVLLRVFENEKQGLDKLIGPIVKELGFKTIGISSVQSQEKILERPLYIDHLLFVADQKKGGGYVTDSNQVLATSSRLLTTSTHVFVFGGGAAAGAELIEASKDEDRTVKFFPSELNHANATTVSIHTGNGEPTHFFGASQEMWLKHLKTLADKKNDWLNTLLTEQTKLVLRVAQQLKNSAEQVEEANAGIAALLKQCKKVELK